MRPVSRALFFLLLTTVLAACRTPYPEYRVKSWDAPVRVSFQPPATPVRERMETTRLELHPDGSVQSEERLTFVARTAITPQPGSYLLTQTAEKIDTTQPTPGELKLARALLGTPLRVHLASDGSFVRLLNAEELAESLRPALSGAPPALLAAFTPEALEEQSRDEWASRYGVFFGRNVTAGQTLYSLEHLPLSDGRSLSWVLERTVAGFGDGSHGRTLILALRCLGAVEDKPELQQLVGNAPLEPTVRCEGRQQLALSPFLQEKGELTLTAKPAGRGEIRLRRTSALIEQ